VVTQPGVWCLWLMLGAVCSVPGGVSAQTCCEVQLCFNHTVCCAVAMQPGVWCLYVGVVFFYARWYFCTASTACCNHGVCCAVVMRPGSRCLWPVMAAVCWVLGAFCAQQVQPCFNHGVCCAVVMQPGEWYLWPVLAAVAFRGPGVISAQLCCPVQPCVKHTVCCAVRGSFGRRCCPPGLCWLRFVWHMCDFCTTFLRCARVTVTFVRML
jgi:hypothetical protein